MLLIKILLCNWLLLDIINMNKIAGIYAIIDIINNKFYVGSSINLKHRWGVHLSELNNNKHNNKYFQRVWNKYGQENFIFTIIEYIKDKNDLIKREQYWIDELNVCDFKIGYNLSPSAGNQLGIKRSKETKAKLSKLHKGKKKSKEHIEKMRINQTGKKYSEETKLKMSNSNKLRWIKRKESIIVDYQKRNFDKWPCKEGRKCSCLSCMEKKRVYYRNQYRLKRSSYPDVPLE